MLVLERKLGESIFIGDDIIVTVTNIRGDKVRIGIDAPREVPVHRGEVYERIQEGVPQGERSPHGSDNTA